MSRFETGVLLGEGGMGRVLEVWDPGLERHVAVKVLHSDDAAAVERMLREARAQARVDHPNVGKIYDVGELRGRPAITMQRIDGRPLGEAVADLPLERRVALMVPAVRAIQAAHAAGLVHRDLKPSNILVEERADGELVPYVVDFGIARETSGTGLTLSGQVVGTPGYMSPEQARGEVRSSDRRSDIFSLGVLLYELVAGQHPFDTGSAVTTLMRILEADPPPLSRVAPQLPVDLRVIVERCLEKERERRYPSAAALADDLERYLHGEPVAARPIGRVERLARRLRRHPVASTLVAGALLVALVGAGFGLATWWRSAEQARAAQAFGRRVERIENVMRLGHVSPLHDLTAERRIVEGELNAVRIALDAGRGSVRGPALDALGRGALSLGRPEQARERFEQAIAVGYDLPRVRLALGRAHLALLAAELREAEQLVSAEQRREARERARDDHGRRARELLATTTVTEPDWTRGERELLRGQLALAAGDFAAARERGLVAATTVPWLYEGLLLAAEADLQEAGRILDASLPEDVTHLLERARTVLEQAAERASSDPAVHAALCRAWRLELDRRYGDGDAVSDPYERGLASCDAALVADPRHLGAWSTRAHLAWRFGRWLRDQGRDPETALRVAAESAERLTRLAGGRVLAQVHLGNIGITRAEWAREQGDDAAVPGLLREAIGHLENAALEGNDPLLYVNLGRAWWQLGSASWGADWEPAFSSAVDAFRSGLDLGSGSRVDLHVGTCLVHTDWAYFATQHGEDPADHTDLAIAACRRALAIDPQQRNALNSLAMAYWTRAEERSARGQASEEDLLAAARVFGELIELHANYPPAHVNRGSVLMDLAELRLGTADVSGLLAEVAEHSAAVREVYPIDYYAHQTRLHLLRALRGSVEGLAAAEVADDFARAREMGRTLVGRWGGLPTNRIQVAAVDRHEAAWRLAGGERRAALRLARAASSEASAALAAAEDLVDAWYEKALAEALVARASDDPAAASRAWEEALEAARRGQELSLGPRPELAELLAGARLPGDGASSPAESG